MDVVNCFDLASQVIEDANGRFAPLWKLNSERLDVFKQYCEIIDLMSEEFDGESFEVEVDEITMEISVTLECGEITVTTKEHVLYELSKRTVKFGFSAAGDNLCVKFVFPSIWDRA